MAFSGFTPRSIGKRDCTDRQVGGAPSTIFSYIAKNQNEDSVDLPTDLTVPPCPGLYHSTAQIDSIQVNTAILGSGGTGALTVTSSAASFSGEVNVGGDLNVSGAKNFDIPHPTKENMRLRHSCIEGPEAAVYFRGKLKGTSITTPEYWTNLVDPDSISVHLTPIGSYQELFVEKIEWGKRIIIKNREGGPVECYYTVYGERVDIEKTIVEYEVVDNS